MDFIKRTAFKRANLEVARVMNHTKQAPRGWALTAKRYESRIRVAEERVAKAKKQFDEKKRRLADVKRKQAPGLARADELVSRQKTDLSRSTRTLSLDGERGATKQRLLGITLETTNIVRESVGARARGPRRSDLKKLKTGWTI